MNNNHHISNQADLERLIQRYFDGETSVQEERELRQCLADCPWTSEAIDEARFTMGYFVAHCQVNQHHVSKPKRHQFLGIAASIAILLAVGVFAFWQTRQANENMCIAYVDGHAIHDDGEVMTLIEDQLNDIDEASHGMAAQLSSLSDAIELDNE